MSEVLLPIFEHSCTAFYRLNELKDTSRESSIEVLNSFRSGIGGCADQKITDELVFQRFEIDPWRVRALKIVRSQANMYVS